MRKTLAFLLPFILILFTSFIEVIPNSTKASKPSFTKGKMLPILIKCDINYVPNNDGYKVVNEYLAYKKMKVISAKELKTLLAAEASRNVSSSPEDFEKMSKMSPQDMMEKIMKNFRTVAQDLYVSVILEKDSATGVHVIVNDAPRKPETKLKKLSLANPNYLRADSLIYTAIDSCISLNYFN